MSHLKLTSVLRSALAVAALAALAACGGNSDNVSRAPTAERVDCAKVTLGLGTSLFEDETVECSYVNVPSDWERPIGETPLIKLAVYRIPSTNPNPAADPVVYLEGGPGGSAVVKVSDFTTGNAAYLRQRGDVYVIDQRGTGYSIPALFCPEVSADPAAPAAAHARCRDRLAAQGVNAAHYNTVFNARDIDAVRSALGIDQWNLYGSSYGTRLALEVMRDHPRGVRSVMLDSVFPPQVNGISEAPFTAYWMIDQLAANCRADDDCLANVGDLKALIEDGIARLAAAPVGDLDAQEYLQLLGDNMATPQLPTIASVIASGTDAEVAELVAPLRDDMPSPLPPPDKASPELLPLVAEAIGMGYGVVCAEEAPYLTSTASPDLSSTFRDSTRAVVDAFKQSFDPSLCAVWKVPAADVRETQAVSSNIPTLVLSGTADPVTPPVWGRLAAATLPASQVFEFDGLPHGVLGEHACVESITKAFLAAPSAALDRSCVAAMPRVDYSFDAP